MAFLDDLEKSLSDPSLGDRLGLYAVSSIQRKIAGGNFTPNARVTSDVKRGSPPLSDRGQLVASIDYRKTAGDVVITSNHVAAGILNSGGTITAKKSWLFIPASRKTRELQRRYGFSPKVLLSGLRADGFSVWRQGRAIFYRQKGPGSSKRRAVMVYILKKSVTIPKREFFVLTDDEIDVMLGMMRGA